MAGRKTPLVNGEIYHVFNRGISLQPTFFDKRDYKRMFDAMTYYQNLNPPMKLSLFLTSSQEKREIFIDKCRKENDFIVGIICYCFMPNHLHFLLRQLVDNGISIFMSKLTNSYTRYLNTKKKRNGPFFQGRFKSVRIESNEQLLHVSRYIHLNLFSSMLVKNFFELEEYEYSSLPEYLGQSGKDYCQKEIILEQFDNINNYRKFVFDQADYQKNLEIIKHLTHE